jgi:hypothetical protein
MVFLIPLAIWLGMLTFVFLVITAILGILVLKGKAKFECHRTLAIITICLAVLHVIFAILLWFFAVVI